MNLKQLNPFHPTGGLGYHARALLNKKRWQPFKDFVESWLMEWSQHLDLQTHRQLVLVGPNAGYTLPRAFIQLFDRVVVVEPDPVAYMLFEARFLAQAHWVRHDYFGLSEKVPRAEALKDLFTAHPNAVILFCNVLGQLPVILRDMPIKSKSAEDKSAIIEKYMADIGLILQQGMKTHKLASYHDRYSRSLSNSNEIIDHLTGDLFRGVKDKKEFPWRISSREEHQIEFVRSE